MRTFNREEVNLQLRRSKARVAVCGCAVQWVRRIAWRTTAYHVDTSQRCRGLKKVIGAANCKFPTKGVKDVQNFSFASKLFSC